MSPNIIKMSSGKGRGFTLVEILCTLSVAAFVLAACVSVYIMGLRWWLEVVPRIEAQRIARIAISTIIDGTIDPTAGTYNLGSVTYGRRNGIAWSTGTPDMPSASQINFRLNKPGETMNTRSFYMETDPITGAKAVYYLDSDSQTHKIDATTGITDLVFAAFGGYTNMIRVTATVERDIQGTGIEPYHIKVEYSDVVFLRNAS